MPQRALVTGATGLLGRQVLRAFDDAGYEAVGTGYSRATDKIRKLDIQDEDAVAALFAEFIVHDPPPFPFDLDETLRSTDDHTTGAADRQPDSCTVNPSAARKLNVQATSTLARLCADSNPSVFLCYISTDYVFPGREGEAPYSASHPASPPNIYGETKHEGEKEVLKHTDSNAVVLRVPVLYGETEPRDNNKESAVNVLIDALWKAKNGESVKMDDWAIRYPTNTQDVARVILDISKLYTSSSSSEKQLPRILQFSSEDRMTKYEICRVFSDVMALSMENVIPDKNGGKPGKDGTVRPFDCHLGTEELKGLGVDIRTVSFGDWWRRWVGAFRH